MAKIQNKSLAGQSTSTSAGELLFDENGICEINCEDNDFLAALMQIKGFSILPEEAKVAPPVVPAPAPVTKVKKADSKTSEKTSLPEPATDAETKKE